MDKRPNQPPGFPSIANESRRPDPLPEIKGSAEEDERKYEDALVADLIRTIEKKEFQKFWSVQNANRLNFLKTLIKTLTRERLPDDTNAFRISEEKLEEIIEIVLCSLLEVAQNEGKELSADSSSQIVNFFITESRHFKTGNIVALIMKSITSFIQNENVASLSDLWIELVSKFFNVAFRRGDIRYDDDLCDSDTFLKHVVNDICKSDWTSNKIPSIIALLREFPQLDKGQVEMIFLKVKGLMSSINFDASGLPPIAYQLLSFSSHMITKDFILMFDAFFPIADWSMDIGHGVSFELLNSSSSTTEATRDARRKALGTTVFHFVQAARNLGDLSKEVLKRITAGKFSYNVVMTPFMLSLALGLTSIETLKTKILECLKEAILKSQAEWETINDYSWFNNVFKYYVTFNEGYSDDIMDLFRPILEHRELEFLVEGFKDLAISLLDVEKLLKLKEFLLAAKSQKLGTRMIIAIIGNYKEMFPQIINDLLKSKNPVYYDVLASCLSLTTTIVIQTEMSGRIHEIIQQLHDMPEESAGLVLKALLPAFQLSPSLFEELLMVLRKTIWKSVSARIVSVTAMCHLLSSSKVMGDIPKEKYSESQTLFFSQVPTNEEVESHSKGEPICSEVFSLLKRYFLFQAEIKESLYLGLSSVVKRNPELLSMVASQLTIQLQKYMNIGKDALLLTNVIQFNKEESKVMEDLGLLTQCCGRVIEKISYVYDGVENKAESLLALETLFDDWVNCLANVTDQDIETQATNIFSNSGLSSKSLDTVAELRSLLTVQIIQSLEAAIEHFGVYKSGKGDLVAQMFQLVLSLEKSINASSKSKKEPDAKGNKNKPYSEWEQRLSHDFTHVMALENVYKILSSLYKKSLVEGLKTLALDARFEHYLLDVICQKTERLIKGKSIRERSRPIHILVKHLGFIGRLIWRECWSSEGSAMEMEMPDTELEENFIFPHRLKALNSILNFVLGSHPYFNQDLFDQLNEDGEGVVWSFKEFFPQWKLTFENYLSSHLNILGLKCLFKILTFAVGTLKSNDQSLQEVNDFVFGFLTKQPGDLGPDVRILAQTIVLLYLVIQNKMDQLSDAMERVGFMAYCVLGDTFEPMVEREKGKGHFWLITPQNGDEMVTMLGKFSFTGLTAIGKDMERLTYNLSYNPREEFLESFIEAYCQQMKRFAGLFIHLTKISIPFGSSVDWMLLSLPLFIETMTSFSSLLLYLHNKFDVAIPKMFEEVVRRIGSDLKPRIEGVDGFIIYLEGLQRMKAEEEAEKKKKKSNGSSGMKSKLDKDAKKVPELIYGMENYEKVLIKLEKKSGVSLLKGTKKSTARDFKIALNEMAQAMESKGSEAGTSERAEEDQRVAVKRGPPGPEEPGAPQPKHRKKLTKPKKTVATKLR